MFFTFSPPPTPTGWPGADVSGSLVTDQALDRMGRHYGGYKYMQFNKDLRRKEASMEVATVW